jgi:SAM-dependent methyltransferase
MSIAKRSVNFISSVLKVYGPSKLKKLLWDREFAGNKWNFMDDTSADCVYATLEKYAQGGDILDLGCGPGNTANELDAGIYRKYIGIDISAAALAKAEKRTKDTGRTEKNSFAVSDFLGYKPAQHFEIILFRESLYHVPYGQVKEILDKYSQFLTTTGAFVVRLYATDISTGEIKSRVTHKLDLLNREFDVVEWNEYETPGKPTVVVFRPRNPSPVA